MLRNWLVLGLLLLASACSVPPIDPAKFDQFTEIQKQHWDQEYEIRAYDELLIDVFPPAQSAPGLAKDAAGPSASNAPLGTSQIKVIVQPDGRFFLPRGAGVFIAEGKTCRALSSELEKILRVELADRTIDVSIQVTQTESWKIWVDGEVFSPGAVNMTKGLTAHQAVSDAGGIRFTGNENYVMVIREDFEGNAAAQALDFEALAAGEVKDISLLPGDVVRVLPTGITRVGRWVRQYIRDVLPIGFGAQVGAGI